MVDGELIIHLQDDGYSGAYSLWIGKRNEFTGKRYAGKIIYEEIPDGMLCEPTLKVSHFNVGPFKELGQQLARLGFVTNETVGELAATKRHLEDMRLLAKVKGKAITHD